MRRFHMHSLALLVFLLACLVADVPKSVGVAQAPAPHTAVPQTHTVRISGFAYEKQSFPVHVGDPVVWVNQDIVEHTVTSPGAFDSGAIAPGMSWKLVPKTPGTFHYICTFHPNMKGTLVVIKR